MRQIVKKFEGIVEGKYIIESLKLASDSYASVACFVKCDVFIKKSSVPRSHQPLTCNWNYLLLCPYCYSNTVFAPTHQEQEQVKIYLSTWTVRAYKSYPTKEGKAQPKAVPHSEVPIQYGKLCLSVCWLKIIEIYNPVWFPFFEKKKKYNLKHCSNIILTTSFSIK